ncbi:Anguibactin system regulator [compost metagenome]
MFAVYQHQLDALLRTTDAADQSFLPRVPQRFLEARLAANDTDIPLPGGLLHDLFAMACREHASRPALLSEQRNLSYDQLWCFSTRLAEQLRGHGVGVNDVVAVLAHRGWRQITAVLAVLQAGGAYLPVDANTPPARREHLIEQPGVKLLLTERALLADMKLPPDVLPLVLEDVLDDGEPGPAVELASAQLPEDLAYVIFTSGSTGRPKGVAISHRGAVNTVQDVIARFGLGASDRVLGVSALNFDLSVYDIFGTLSCGAALVLPAPSAIPAPDQWGSCVQDYGVTVWNSVPALLDMQLEYSGTRAAAELATLRLVMLSGDWIPVALPERLAAQVPRALLVSLGGATEASIWSNYFVVRKVDPAWTSIPYGWPLSNQRYHVLNAALQPVPTWVAGHLYIAGSGLAQGYYLDAVRTSASFIYHPTSGERLYRTGDVGRYHPSGYLEFLGRNDNQVKIRGFRIEIGEIESALERCAGVRNAAVVVREVGQRDRQLLGFYVAHSVGDIALTPETVRRELAESMPDYMVPPVLVELERLPVSSNGKLDRAALAIVARHHQLARAVRVAPRNATEQGLAALWQKLLEGEEPGVHDNFFELGGTSLLAVRLLHMIAEKFDRQLALASLLRHGTIAAQAELLQQERSPVTRARRSALVMLQEGASDGPLLLAPHPVGGNVLCYRALAALVPAGVTVAGLQSPGDGSARTVDGMADDYLRQVAPLLRQRRALYLLGWSMGGVIASQMAHQMEAAGNRVNALVMIDSWSGATDAPADATLTGAALLHSFVSDLLAGDGVQNWQAWHELSEDECIDAAMEVLRTQGAAAGQLPRPLFLALLAEHAANYNALIRHRPALLSVPTRQYRASRTQAFPLLEPVVQGRVTHLERDHFTIIDEAELARIVAAMFAPTM